MDSNIMLITIGLFILITLVSIISQLRDDITRMKATLDKIAKQIGVPDLVTKDIKDELKSLISEGKKVKAIKRYRTITGVGLKEAKEYIDQLSI
ncbi:ribosomal protein L7/L12 [uncultured Clostridium sp.]|uniref:ribosomal protein L7/L12 n=1 Tax=uncultured Clostridium sp. TaxID=59620 RepID=UPI0008231574|nr:ribosomal protein L7/L12 [uncultured Clostridium sp.]SCI72447.1 ribosomal protein L7/L12 [uncultured Clostridium sp.]